MARVAKFFTPGSTRGRDQQVEAMQAREERYGNAVTATVAAAREAFDAEGERIERLAAELGLEKFVDPLQDLDSRLARAIEVAKARLEILSIERALGGTYHAPGVGITAPLSADRRKHFETRLAALKTKIGEPATKPAPRPVGELPEQIERALAVADAKPLAKRAPPEKLRAGLLEAIDEMELGRGEIADLIETNRKEASFAANLKAKAAHDTLLVELYHAAQKFAAVAATEQTFRMMFPALGLTARSDLLPMPGPLMRPIIELGSGANYGSALAEFGRWLASRELLK